MLKNSLFQPFLSFCFNTFLPFSALAAAFFFLCFGCPFFLFSVPFFFFCFFFLPYLFKVQPFTCCNLTQPKKPKRFSAFQPKRFCFNSATLSSCFFCFILFWFSPKMLHSAQNVFSFLFFRLPFIFQPKCSAQNLFQLLHVSLFE